ncbi:MAG: cytochrome c-type biogenesis CcmF C-terminal domain-containing protein, partial [Burkholderiaceae bacterium]
TFLVRSGVLTSVHAFATDPARGVFILAFLTIVIGGSLTLFAWRAQSVGNGNSFSAVSRESMLLANNIVLVVAMAAVLLGTLYPLILDTLDLGKISVGPPYFDAVFFPLMAPALFLIGVGPLARWKSADVPELAQRLKWAFAISVVAALLLPLTVDGFRPMTSTGLMFGIWIAASVVVNLWQMLRTPDGRLALRRARLYPASVWGMHLAHLGVAAFVIGVTVVNSYSVDREQRVEIGQLIEIGGYQLRFTGAHPVAGPNYDAMRGRFEVHRIAQAEGEPLKILSPEKRVYRASGQTMTEAAIDRSLRRDLYLSLGDPLDGQAWIVRIHLRPLVNWIWLGCVLMAGGGFFAIADRRYRRRRQHAEALAARGHAAAAGG